MENKKLIIKRIIIFFVLAIFPVIIIAACVSKGFTVPIYDDVMNNQILVSISGLGMLAPALAVVITRLITKEGFGENYLAINFRGNARYYIASILIPLFNSIPGTFLIWLFYLDMPFGEAFTLEYLDEAAPYFFLTLAMSLIIITGTFGEEWGWRGYLMPKLLKIMNKPMAIIIGGIIWGLWHAPLTIIGHNFTTKIPGFPFSGIGLMCLFCILMNATMTFITERTKSIYPTCFCHGVTNNLGISFTASMVFTLNASSAVADISNYELFLPMFISAFIPAAVCTILYLRKEK